jgi:hypothetical protein
MIAPAPQIRWRPAFVALVLGLAALLRVLPVAVQGQTLADLGASLEQHVLCLGTASAADVPGPAMPNHEECQSCCLPAGRMALALPAILPPVPQLLPLVMVVEAPAWPAVAARAPPYEAWSKERAQRGPPPRLVA